MKTILITGGNGMIGSYLSALLLRKKYTVLHLNRSPGKDPAIKTFCWDVKRGIMDEAALRSAQCIVHLAGANIAGKRWTAQRKKELIESRTESARLLYSKIEPATSVKTVIAASAVGYYGAVTTDAVFRETDGPGKDFLAECCIEWERSTDLFASKGLRTVKLRFAPVLSATGGSLPQLAKPVKWFAGAALGSGEQYFPWIHVQDVCNLIVSAIENESMQGVYNAVAPEHISNKQLVQQLAKTLGKPLILPNLPAFVLRIGLGEMAVMLLEGSRVAADKILSEGFTFKYPSLKGALESLRHEL